MYASVTARLKRKAPEDLCKPDPEQTSNCALFARCFRHKVKAICLELPGCCSNATEEAGCVSENDNLDAVAGVFSDFRKVMGWDADTTTTTTMTTTTGVSTTTSSVTTVTSSTTTAEPDAITTVITTTSSS